MIKTKLHRKKNAYRWVPGSGQDAYIILGGTTPWIDDNNPPVEDISQISIPDAFCAIKAQVKLVVPDGGGTFEFVDATGFSLFFSEIHNLADLRALNDDTYVSVYVSGTVTGNYIADIIFRQVGIVTDLTPATGHENDIFLPNGLVEDWGDLETLQYRPPTALAVSSSQYTVSTLFQY